MGGYLPGTERERRDMLAALGLSSADELFAALPEGVRLKGLSLPEGLSQQGVERRIAGSAPRSGSGNQGRSASLRDAISEHYSL